MKKQILAGVTAFSLALAGVSAPARAQNDDLGRLIVGIAGIAMLNAALSGQMGRQSGPSRPAPAPVSRPTYAPLPQQCLTQTNANRGQVSLYAQGCMQQSYEVSVLPRYCLTTVSTIWGPQAGYEAQCLYTAGFRPADRFGRSEHDVPRGRALGHEFH